MRFGALPQVASILYAVKPVVVVIVLQALWRLARVALKDTVCIAVALLAIVSGFLHVHELLILLSAGVAMPIVRDLVRRGRRSISPALLVGVGSGASLPTTTALGAAVPFGLWPLFMFFVKVGAVLFGSGYVLLAFLPADLVERWHWLTEAQLLDAVAVGQITPGPVFTTATFIGYLLAGPVGAVVATVGIFLPAFFFVAISGPLIPRLRRSAIASSVLDGVNAGSLALMAVVTWHLGRAAVHDWPAVFLGIAAGVLLWRWKVNSAWLILGAGVVGLVLGRWW